VVAICVDEMRRIGLYTALAKSSTMVLDSSGTCDGELRMAVGNALGDCG